MRETLFERNYEWSLKEKVITKDRNVNVRACFDCIENKVFFIVWGILFLSPRASRFYVPHANICSFPVFFFSSHFAPREATTILCFFFFALKQNFRSLCKIFSFFVFVFLLCVFFWVIKRNIIDSLIKINIYFFVSYLVFNYFLLIGLLCSKV